MKDLNVHETMDDRWAFNAEVTEVFDEMLARSIPDYQTMRATVAALGRRYVRPGTAIVDLGCSRGGALAPFVEEFGGRRQNTFIGCEVSQPMREAAALRFADEADVFIQNVDLRNGYPRVKSCSLTLAVLTLQFVPINYRQKIIQEAYDRTVKGGALVVVEKILGASADLDEKLVDLYHDAKGRAGYSREEIERKRLALEGVLVPLTADWNVELLRRAGFSEVDGFWRYLNFAAWIAVR